jgi:tetratricopeptide (TPR) repeat protein
MVDFEVEIKKIRPINIKEMELSKYRIGSNIKKSIILYNMATGEIEKGNFDLAIKDLKKALSYNKGFTEAIKLMGLCYVNMKKYKKAEKNFKKLDTSAIYNELANEYMQSLSVEKSTSENMKTVEAVSYTLNNKEKQHIIDRRLRGQITIGLSIVMISMAGVGINYFYSVNIQEVLAKFPVSIQDVLEKFQANNKIVNTEEEKDKKLDEDASSLEKNTIAYEDYQNVQKNLEDTKLELDNYKNKYNTLTMLSDAEKSFDDGNYEETANTLISMKSMNFDDETKIRFDKLWQDLKTKALWPIYNQGNSLYKQKKYQEALPKLKIASQIDPNLDIMQWINYQIGTCYKETHDNANALIYFKQVRDNYPKSNYTSYAEMIINEIEN